MSTEVSRLCLNVAIKIISMATSSTLSMVNNLGSHYAIWGN